MLKFMKSLKVAHITENLSVVTCGRQTAVAEWIEDDVFIFTYIVSGHESAWMYEVSKEGVEEAVWEWLCTLSRATRPDNGRTLGSMRKSYAEAA